MIRVITPPREPSATPPKTRAEQLRDLRLSLANIPRAFSLVWQASRWITVVMALLTVIGAALPISQAWVGKLIIDGVGAAVRTGAGAQAGLVAVAPYLTIEFGLLFLGAVAGQGRTLVEHVLHARLAHHVNTAIIRKALELDLQVFEDASFYDKLQNARREADYRALGIVNGGFMMVQQILTLVTFAIGLLAFSPLIGLVLFGATIPSFIAQNRFAGLHFRLLNWRAPEKRRMDYFEYLLTVDSSVKEVKLFNLGDTLLKRYEQLFWKFYREDLSLAQRSSFYSLAWGLVATASFYGAYAWIVWQTVAGAITLGGMVFYLTIFRQSQGTFQSILGGATRLYESGLFMDNLFAFLGLAPAMPAPASTTAPQIRQGIEFRNVSFRYPGRSEWAIQELNLHIRPGEKLALVGANGAGKTTLIKLLTRLYDPTEGQILLDGVDLREWDPAALRARIGVIFQDFVRYQLSVRENIGFGQIDALDEPGRVEHAARRGGADEVASGLPQGYETMLGKWFNEGQELSGGQWQKVALGRAFMRDSDILVLDEPTAALDAEREYEIFQRFRELTAGKIAVLISHRFSTVRMADRIAVIEHGRLIELGTHAELLEHGGTYARLFSMQAEGYR